MQPAVHSLNGKRKASTVRDTTDFIQKNENLISCRFKPIYGVREKEIIGAEIVFGTRARSGEWADPVAVLREAEKNGCVNQIDLWVFKQACELMSTINNPQIRKIHIHLAFGTFRNFQNIREIEELTKRYRVNPKRFCLWFGGITGQTEKKYVKDIKHRLRKQGFSIGADEFRKGRYDVASQESLRDDAVWINRNLVVKHSEGALAGILLGTMLKVYRDNGVEIIADGIMNGEQAERMERYGCTALAGPFISSQLSAAKFIDKYGSNAR